MSKIKQRIDSKYADEVVSFMKEWLPKVSFGKIKIVSWGWWPGATSNRFRLTIDWEVEENK